MILEWKRGNAQFFLERLLDKVMERERQRFLESHEGEQANGSYPRKLHLKVPRVRYANSFRPAILPPPWKRVDKDYEELLIAMLDGGYSRAQMERALKTLGLPFSPEALEEVQGLIREKLDFYKTQPLKSDWFATLIVCWGKLRTEGGKVEEIPLWPWGSISMGTRRSWGFGCLRAGRTRASGPRSSRIWSAVGSTGCFCL